MLETLACLKNNGKVAFWKTSEKRGGSFPIQKVLLQIFFGNFEGGMMNFRENFHLRMLVIDERGGGCKKPPNLADVICEQPLNRRGQFLLFVVFNPSVKDRL